MVTNPIAWLDRMTCLTQDFIFLMFTTDYIYQFNLTRSTYHVFKVFIRLALAVSVTVNYRHLGFFSGANGNRHGPDCIRGIKLPCPPKEGST